MTARPAERHPLSRWLVGCAEIAAYSGDGIEMVRAALASGELVGFRRGGGETGTWKTLPEHVDNWIEGKRPALVGPE